MFFKKCDKKYKIPLNKVASIVHKVENILKVKRELGFNPITFTLSENSNYGRESLLEV